MYPRRLGGATSPPHLVNFELVERVLQNLIVCNHLVLIARVEVHFLHGDSVWMERVKELASHRAIAGILHLGQA